MNTKLQSLLHALGVVLYTAFIAWFLNNGERFFGQIKSFWGPLMILLLFMISALITSSLVFAKPIMLYLNGKKKEGMDMFLYTAGWLIVITAVLFLLFVII
ncbi:MAG: hypothetical protein Q8Q23_00455 [bacterium]|nr:hypothetical protein [bacterium]